MDGEIDPDEVAAALESDDPPAVVDIRSRKAFERGHLPGSVNVPMEAIPQHVDRLSDADHIVTVCPHGQASIQAARLIASYEDTDAVVESMAGGLDAWDGPLERAVEEPADATDV
jgi:rhodanese-related sulfurtransferase